MEPVQLWEGGGESMQSLEEREVGNGEGRLWCEAVRSGNGEPVIFPAKVLLVTRYQQN